MSKQTFTQKYIEITDKEKIAEYDRQLLYIAPIETEDTLDQDILSRGGYNQSAETVGRLREIEVAVWEEDPNKDSISAHDRIHLRIINGRHRYISDGTWKRKYFDFSKFEDPIWTYFEARQHFDLQKKSSIEERQALITQMGEHLMKKGIPASKVCAKLVEILVPQGISGETTIRMACPKKFKDVEKTNKTVPKLDKKKESATEGKKDDVIDKLQEQNTELHKESLKIKEERDMVQSENENLASLVRILGALESTEKIDDITVHAKVDSDNKKIVITKL